MIDKKNLIILIIEDDDYINNLLNDLLTRDGFNCRQAFSGTEGKIYFENEKFHLILLDLMLPGLKGESLLQYIRNKSSVPIIALTAKDQLEDKVNLLLNGVDDYITKPFHSKELLARIEATLRRYLDLTVQSNLNTTELLHKNLRLNISSREVFVKSFKLELTPKEFAILELLLNNKEKVFTKENLFTSVWNGKYIGEDNTVSVHISNLRLKISAVDKDNEYIKTIWGIGFKIST